MKIGMIYSYHKYPPKSGGDVHFYQLVKNISKLGHDVFVFYWNEHPDANVLSYSKKELLRFIYSIDALYIRITWSYLDKYILLKLMRPTLPLFIEVNAPYEEIERRNINKYWAKKSFLHRFSFLINGIFVVSKNMKQYMNNYLKGKKVFVVPNGSDPDMFKGATKDFIKEPLNIFWMGSSKYPWQGLKLIENLAKRVNRVNLLANQKIKFTLLTDKKYLPDSLLSNPYFDILDEVSYLSVPNYLKEADICLCLYNIDYYKKLETGFYNSPLKLFDYMSSAKLVIGSDIGQISEVIQNYYDGLLTNNKIEDLLNKIEWLLNNKDKIVELGKNAREKIIKWYNWERVAKDTIAFIKDCT